MVPVGLTLAGCAGTTGPENPVPEPVRVVAADPSPPPPPAPAPSAPAPVPAAPAGDLPAWDEVPSDHPPGATNPPSPVLLVTPSGECHKSWVSPFLPMNLRRSRVVAACPDPDPEGAGDCGVRVQCPPEAEALLAAWKAEHPG